MYPRTHQERSVAPHTVARARPNSRPGGLAVSELLNPLGDIGRHPANTEHPRSNANDRHILLPYPGSSFALTLERQNSRPPPPILPLRGPSNAPDAWSLYEQSPPWTIANSNQNLFLQPRPQMPAGPRYTDQQAIHPSNHQIYQALPSPATVGQPPFRHYQSQQPRPVNPATTQQALPNTRNAARPSTDAAVSSRPQSHLEPINYRLAPGGGPQMGRRRGGAYALPSAAYEGQGQLQTASLSPLPTLNQRNPFCGLKSMDCSICLETFSVGGKIDHFPHKCNCDVSDICGDCLKDWFIDACKNEIKMPPKCCKIIPISSVSSLLNPAEIEVYKTKFEEWSTTDRIYCPVPRCSAFVPPSLYLQKDIPKKAWGLISNRSGSRRDPQLVSHPFLNAALDSAAPPQPPKIKSDVECPNCQTQICTACRSYLHTGKCPPDLDPKLEQCLRRWKTKRCPKCRTGIRKVYGCPHVECRCGAHFCWGCLQSISVCPGACEYADSDASHEDQEFDEDDIDGRIREGDGDFGGEPNSDYLQEQWACPGHKWNPSTSHPNGSIECHHCFKTVVNSNKFFSKDADMHMAGYSTQPGWPPNMYGEPAWQCIEGHLCCERCPRLPPPHRADDDSWEVTCLCRMTCRQCVAMKKEKEKDIAWECRCGMVVCYDCKAVVPTINLVADANARAAQETRMARLRVAQEERMTARAREERALFGRSPFHET